MFNLVNELYVILGNVLVKSSERALEKAAKKAASEEKLNNENNDLKAEIIEFKKFNDNVTSALNVEFTTVEDGENRDKRFSEDNIANYIEDIVSNVVDKSQLNLDSDKDINDIKLTTLAILLADNKAQFNSKISKEFLRNRDDIVELNTIYKFLTGTKFFTNESAIELREVITSQLLYDITMAIYDTDEFINDIVMTGMVEKVRKRLELELASNVKLGGDIVEAISPIMFNNGILNGTKQPKVAKTTEEYLKDYLINLMDKDWVEKNSISIEMTPKGWTFDNYPSRDTGAVLVSIKSYDTVIKMYTLDLDTITGTGYSLEIPANIENNIVPMYVSIEKYPEIIKKALSQEFYTLNNPVDPESIQDFISVISTTFGPQIYNYYDMSDMSKHIAFLTNEEFFEFGNNLMLIETANWEALGAPQYRMRIRKFKSPSEFTLVSDRNTRQQLPDMQPVFGGNPKKYFKDPDEDIATSDILVCKFKDGKIDVAVNGTAVKSIMIPEKPDAIQVTQ